MPDLDQLPGFRRDAARRRFSRETELFFDSIVREDRSALDLLTADYTFLNERLARHYGIPNVNGSHFRRVTLEPDSLRGGLLGQGSILTVTSYPDRTSPVVRGKWILENLLGTPPPPPPPNVPELKPTGDAGAGAVDARADGAAPREPGLRQLPRDDGSARLCARELRRGRPVAHARRIVASRSTRRASLPDGTTFDGAAGLQEALLAQSDQVVTTLTEKLLTYALGRGLEYYDAPAVRAIVREARAQDYRFTSLILGVVQSAPFQMRMARQRPSAQIIGQVAAIVQSATQ